MILNIYLIGVAIAFFGLLIYHFSKDEKMRYWPSDILFTIVMASLSWITVIISIASIKIAIREFKARKNQEKRIIKTDRISVRKHPETPLKQIHRRDVLEPIRSSELKKSIESFSEN